MSLEVIRNATIWKLASRFLSFHSNYGSILYDFRDKVRCSRKSRFFMPAYIRRPVRGVLVGLLSYRLVPTY